MGYSQGSGQVQCPFYHGRDNRVKKIVCEGVIDGSSCAQCFDKKADYQDQIRNYCESEKYWNYCEIARAINGKY